MAWHDAAAVLFHMDLRQLRPISGVMEQELSADIYADCALIRQSNETLWALRRAPRIAALKWLLAHGQLSAALAANPHEQLRPVNALFSQLLHGRPFWLSSGKLAVRPGNHTRV